MTAATVVPVRGLAASVAARLRDQLLADDTVFTTEAIDPPLLPGQTDGLVKPYVVFHPSVGDPVVEMDLGDCAVELDWLMQVTCAAGLVEDCLALVDRVNTALFRWVPTLDGFVCGPLRVPPGYRPSVLPDRSVTPHRPFVPLQFRSLITTA